MRLLTVASLLAIVVASTSAFQQPTFKSGARTVAVYATVTDKDGRLVPDLTKEDFEIQESGKSQPIAVFSNEVQPISVVIMLDRSGSMRGNFGLVEAAGEAFVRAMLPADRARIGSFAEKVQIDPEAFISEKKELINILRTKLQNEGPTPLWNAVDASIAALKEQDGRKVVLAFTDGADNPGNFKLNNLSFMDIMRRAQVADVMVYAVGLESASRPAMGGGGLGGGGFGGGSRPDPGLPAIAEQTGAGYFELRRAQDLAATFARVADELHRQYLIGFVPEKLDDKMHKLEVRVKKSGMKVRARKEYFAAK
ncbi:MAG: VWA domain-containing protein [Acidobacteriota bacterium]|nr:VWA domain-containing protein [Acidobacteriota bacterium]